MVPKRPFGATGHHSSRAIFGAAALGGMRQEKADQILELLLEHGVNHIDTAAAYGESELRIAPWMREHRDRFFLATKTGDRSYDGAKASIERSLERLGVDRIDLLQLHNLVQDDDWERVFAPGGALGAAIEAQEQGLVRFLGVTGHGTRVAEMHLRSLERHPFDSVLLPYHYAVLDDARTARELEQLAALCAERDVAVQTIKSIARRRWVETPARRFSWYEPLRDEAAIRRAVHWVLARERFFLNTSSDATLLPTLLAAAAEDIEAPSDRRVAADVEALGIEPLFVRGVREAV